MRKYIAKLQPSKQCFRKHSSKLFGFSESRWRDAWPCDSIWLESKRKIQVTTLLSCSVPNWVSCWTVAKHQEYTFSISHLSLQSPIFLFLSVLYFFKLNFSKIISCVHKYWFHWYFMSGMEIPWTEIWRNEEEKGRFRSFSCWFEIKIKNQPFHLTK